MSMETRKPKGPLQTFLAGSIAALATLSTASAMDFPREGVADIPNGVAAPFAGTWWIGYPEGEGMINGAPRVDCDAPVELVPQGDANLLLRTADGTEVPFELLEFSGRTTWLPAQGESIIAVWVDADAFFTYSVDLATGKARWQDPSVYRRCP